MAYELGTADRRTRAADLGKRAAQIRGWLGLSLEDVSREVGFPKRDVELFEKTGNGTIELVLALAHTISSGNGPETLFQTPKFTSLEQVTAFERQRRAHK